MTISKNPVHLKLIYFSRSDFATNITYARYGKHCQ
jgi:hypothetical protein